MPSKTRESKISAAGASGNELKHASTISLPLYEDEEQIVHDSSGIFEGGTASFAITGRNSSLRQSKTMNLFSSTAKNVRFAQTFAEEALQ